MRSAGQVDIKKNILCRSGFYLVWLNQGVKDVKTFQAVFRQRLVDIFIQEWSSTIREKDIYDMYRCLKSAFGMVNSIFDSDIIRSDTVTIPEQECILFVQTPSKMNGILSTNVPCFVIFRGNFLEIHVTHHWSS